MIENKILIIANNGVDLHFANESFDEVCTAMSKKYASDIKSAYNACYGSGINPEAVKEMLQFVERMAEAHRVNALTSEIWSMCYDATKLLEKAKIK